MPVSACSTARRLAFIVVLAGAAALSGCATSSPYDELQQAQPSGSQFAQALFQDYSYLARSFGLADTPSTTAFDASASISIANLDNDVAEVADVYAQKAIKAAKGDEPLPEAAPLDDTSAENLRMKLLRALDEGRTKAPRDAALAQVNYDCWVINGRVDQLSGASAHCKAAFHQSLAKLERDLNMGPAPAAASETPKPAPAKNASFTVHFTPGSARLDTEARDQVADAISAARTGRQSKIRVTGYTDTTGSQAANLALSKRRADAVRAALIGMGARPAAIEVTGNGESDLAVSTGENVQNADNRRVVITLIP